MKVTDEYVFFWGGVFSQWYPCTFIIDDTNFNCAEQWMMLCKAKHFKDVDTAVKIMMAEDPYRQKMLGRSVKKFKINIWNNVAIDYVVSGNVAKFGQNPILLKHLLETENKIIVEASPNDRIWGIGLGEDDPKALDPTLWQGKNWLGISLMRARDMLR